eukprot:CAMPEP_0201487298 /NCGR_PEP_ID=MMETSP0151_2-20130828/12200_1 /ASSEMBLY_ACC=CAM_ASM_000257 /TAXON_ID=200890 /ORGANISM="Paramoeba atlantica, Strain 621/1 / CCAP 1560/9" /LENGTH=164 /DNA_ID=CAMNT_0047872297 /DNA_START=290 /DNA_END=781 /DNA_ORIENTATION=-
MSEEIPEDRQFRGETQIDKNAIKHLSSALVFAIFPHLNQVEKKLIEIEESQKDMIQILTKENEAMKDVPQLLALQQVLRRIPEYRAKVEKLRRDMKIISARSKDLKRRSLAIKEVKDREARHTRTVRDQANIRERQLLAASIASEQSSSSSSSSSPSSSSSSSS